MIDLHCHVLPGIDDGPRTIDESLALMRAAQRAGTQTIVATPHVSRRYPNDVDTIARLVEELGARLRSERSAVAVRSGAEIELAQIPHIPAEQLPRLGLGQGRWLLVEPPFGPLVPELGEKIMDLQQAGQMVVLAHPERCPTFHRDPAMLASLVRGGALTSVTAGALVGRFGKDVRDFALDLAEAGMLHSVASDAHDAHRRPPNARDELDQAGLGWLTEWLTQEVPAAILGDEAIPRRPNAPRAAARSRLGLSRGRRAPARVSRWPRAHG